MTGPRIEKAGWIPDGDSRRGDLHAATWFTSCEVLACDGTAREARTGDEEGCLVVLSGCHDLYAGGGSWIERGVRDAPGQGRPVVVFLPPNTPFKVENGRGEVLRIGCRRPPPPAAAQQGEAPQKKPLLAMAGSGKAFDPETGTWTPQEQLPDSPEALLPRRIERKVEGDLVRERILPLEYKARALVAAEIWIPDGATAAFADDDAFEHLLLVRATGSAHWVDGAEAASAGEDGLWVASSAAPGLRAEGGPAWVLHAQVASKPTGR